MPLGGEVDADARSARRRLLRHAVAPITLGAPAHDDQVTRCWAEGPHSPALRGSDEKAAARPKREDGHDALRLESADVVPVPGGGVMLVAIEIDPQRAVAHPIVLGKRRGDRA